MSAAQTKTPAAWCDGGSAWNPGLTRLTPQSLSSGRAQRSARKILAMSSLNNKLVLQSAEIIREGRMAITPHLGREIVAHMCYKNQRPVQPHHAALLANSMARGRFTPGTQIAFARLNGWPHLVNGQHRIHAVIQSGITIEFQVLIIDVATEDELAAVYYRFDVEQRSRTIAEVLNAVQIAERYSISQSAAKATLSAATWIKAGFNRPDYRADPSSRGIDTKFENAAEWWTVARLLDQALAPAESHLKRRLFNTGVTSVALITLRHQQAKAWDFWSGVAANDGLKKRDPRNTLVAALYEKVTNGTSFDGRSAMPAVAWNAFYRNTEIGFIRVGEAKNIRILGTPYTIGAEPKK